MISSSHDAQALTVSTDGSALGNPNGPMGWGWVDHHGSGCDAGGASNGTNQIGELCAVLQALRAHAGDVALIIESDSKYAIQCSTVWLKGWKRNGWKNSKKQPVKNLAIIRAIDHEISSRQAPVEFVWVKGHAGNEFNEKVDDLAHGYATAVGKGHKQGYLPLEGWQSLIDSDYATGLVIPDEVKTQLAGSANAASNTSPITNSGRQTAKSGHTAKSAPTHDNAAIRAPQASALSVSGSIRITPPPSSSSTHTQHARRVVGSIAFDAVVDSNGKATLTDAPLHITHMEIINNVD